VRAAITGAIDLVMKYPDPNCTRLKDAIAARNRCSPDAVICGNGAVELIFAVAGALRPGRTLIGTPSFCEYQLAARASGSVVELVPPKADTLELDLPSMADKAVCGDLVIFCNPNNPTGLLSAEKELRCLADRCGEVGATLLVDEAFMDFLPDWRDRTAGRWLNEVNGLVVLRSTTKFYAIPGLRLGYALASPCLVKAIELHKDPWSVNALAQEAGIAALNDEDYEAATRRIVSGERRRIYEGCSSIAGLQPLKGASANFILHRVPDHWADSGSFSAALLENCHIAVRDCSSFDNIGNRHIRTAIRTPEENERLLEAFSKMAGEVKQ
jgi:threonine-phosphate decarboxylase